MMATLQAVLTAPSVPQPFEFTKKEYAPGSSKAYEPLSYLPRARPASQMPLTLGDINGEKELVVD